MATAATRADSGLEAAKWERLADQRLQAADERDVLADLRERRSDRRDTTADDRDARADRLVDLRPGGSTNATTSSPPRTTRHSQKPTMLPTAA